MELFRDPCGGDSQFIHDKGYYVGFIEGWALYGENPVLSDDVKLYADDKDILQRLGMFKWQVDLYLFRNFIIEDLHIDIFFEKSTL